MLISHKTTLSNKRGTNVTHHYHTWSEREMGGGFVDLYLEPFIARFPSIQYGYLIELKYRVRGESARADRTQKVSG